MRAARAGHGGRCPRGFSLPAFLLAALALPYLPWLADVVPAVDALAGPGRWWLWAIALGQIVWLTITWMFDARARERWPPGERPFSSSPPARRSSCSAPGVWCRDPSIPGGDEPHYLVITQSLLTDHDLAIENNHARGDYRAYYASPLKPDYRVTGLNRTIYSIHPIGISVIVAPAFALAGYHGALGFVALLAAIAMTLQWRWLRASADRTARPPWAGWPSRRSAPIGAAQLFDLSRMCRGARRHRRRRLGLVPRRLPPPSPCKAPRSARSPG